MALSYRMQLDSCLGDVIHVLVMQNIHDRLVYTATTGNKITISPTPTTAFTVCIQKSYAYRNLKYQQINTFYFFEHLFKNNVSLFLSNWTLIVTGHV